LARVTEEAAPRETGTPAVFAVFAVFAGNYQRATSSAPQKSWSFGAWGKKEQRERLL
jgi:hypothetical protein